MIYRKKIIIKNDDKVHTTNRWHCYWQFSSGIFLGSCRDSNPGPELGLRRLQPPDQLRRPVHCDTLHSMLNWRRSGPGGPSCASTEARSPMFVNILVANLVWKKQDWLKKNLWMDCLLPGRGFNCFIVKILNLYILLLCTHLYHTSFRYLSSIAGTGSMH